MSKKRIRKSEPQQQHVRCKLTKTIAALIAICVAATGAAVSRWEPLRRTLGLPSAAVAPATPQSSGNLSLAKEYIYAGGRLIATEEPAALAPPAAPSNLRLGNKVIIWNDNSDNESGFKIEEQHYIGNGTWSAWTQVATVEANITSFAIGQLCDIFYRVKATNAKGDSAPSNAVDPCVVSTPSLLILTAEARSPTRVELTWGPPSGTVDHYEIERSQSSNGYTSDNYVTLSSYLSPSTTTFIDEPATSGTAFVYRVRAVMSKANPIYSNSDLATTIIFENDPVQSGVTPIRAKHINQLRDAVQAVSLIAGRGAVTWSQPAPANGVRIMAAHIEELREKLDPALAVLGLPAPAYFTDPHPPSLSGKRVMAAHINELRARVK
jgi:hypothetical protein